MRARDAKLRDVLNRKGQFLVPPYQRRYQWGAEHIAELFEDVLRIGRDPVQTHRHYTGALVVHPDPEDPVGDVPRWYIVDGQQRLTTISMILAAIGLAADGGGSERSRDAIEDDYLKNRHAPPARKLRLELQDPDNLAWGKILNGVSALGDNTRIAAAWDLIQRTVAGNSVHHLYRGLGRLEFIWMELSGSRRPAADIREPERQGQRPGAHREGQELYLHGAARLRPAEAQRHPLA